MVKVLPDLEEEVADKLTIVNNSNYIYNSKIFHTSYFDGVEERYWKINNVLNGQYTSLYPNNKIKIRCNYLNGKLDGEYFEYNIYGELVKECTYLNGMLHGPYREYHPFFQTKYIECFYVENKLHGLYTKYDDNYNLKYYVCNYSNGKKIFNPIQMLFNGLNAMFVRNIIDLENENQIVNKLF